jgi:choline dehydrogenase
MGPRSDVLAVVDDKLKVHGVAGLRVVDASIMPVIVRGHPQAAVVAIAEKASGMILADVEVAEVSGLAGGGAATNGRSTASPGAAEPVTEGTSVLAPQAKL